MWSVKKDFMKTSKIIFDLPADYKNGYTKAASSEGLKLKDWIIKQCNEALEKNNPEIAAWAVKGDDK